MGPRIRKSEQDARREFATLHARAQAAARQQQQRRPRQAPPRPPPPQPRRNDPALRAREILGFQPGDRLDKDTVKKRQRALASVYHPDLPGGSTEQMKKVNEAVGVLLANLA